MSLDRHFIFAGSYRHWNASPRDRLVTGSSCLWVVSPLELLSLGRLATGPLVSGSSRHWIILSQDRLVTGWFRHWVVSSLNNNTTGTSRHWNLCLWVVSSLGHRISSLDRLEILNYLDFHVVLRSKPWGIRLIITHQCALMIEIRYSTRVLFHRCMSNPGSPSRSIRALLIRAIHIDISESFILFSKRTHVAATM